MKLFLALLLLCGEAQAQLYLTAGFGQATMKEVELDGWWHQEAFGHVTEEKSNAWKLGVGFKLNRYLSAELDYRDLGQFNQHILSVSDLGGPGSYNANTKQCNGPCEATSSSYQHGYTKGIGLSLVAAPDWPVAPFVRIGYLYHFSNFYSSQRYGSVPYQVNPVKITFNNNGFDGPSFKSEGLGRMIGFGVRASWLSVEYTRYPDSGPTNGPWKDVETLMVNVNHDF